MPFEISLAPVYCDLLRLDSTQQLLPTPEHLLPWLCLFLLALFFLLTSLLGTSLRFHLLSILGFSIESLPFTFVLNRPVEHVEKVGRHASGVTGYARCAIPVGFHENRPELLQSLQSLRHPIADGVLGAVHRRATLERATATVGSASPTEGF